MRKLFGALTLAGATLAALASTPSASAENDGHLPIGAAATCYASSCTGQWPDKTGCASDAITAKSKTISGRVIELRYSPTCRAAWGRIRNGVGGDYVSVHSSSGTEYWKAIPIGSTTTFTGMVNDAGLFAYACTPVGGGTCTGTY
ncbi:DUF2690 domain-containing protein [Saccharothrix coeruleofusca]|uniref:DUF2690 domain-containing protein n=1 Tax=Saccharothrix coeruleofusca TaxID=33919 RepID=A0A918EDY6_9PSEU|nr:DUF2690 domain-containing protein [Saccharothrix coeruleofusca]GGP53633.1 hypothetical protein GCM10010185_27240 [Saccharothrix coeruleofusca]